MTTNVELIGNKDIVAYLLNHGYAWEDVLRCDVSEDIKDTIKVSVVEHEGNILLQVPLPCDNPAWSFAAFDYVREFCKVFTKCYPTHCSVPETHNLYVKICE